MNDEYSDEVNQSNSIQNDSIQNESDVNTDSSASTYNTVLLQNDIDRHYETWLAVWRELQDQDQAQSSSDNEGSLDSDEISESTESDHESHKIEENVYIDDATLKRCEHYDRGCHLLFPCCNKFYPCRFCHNSESNDYKLAPEKMHDADRKSVEIVKCRYCETEQDIGTMCTNCSKPFGNYYCKICKLLDLADKGQFHCEKCGICRQGGKDNFQHCDTCGLCVPHTSLHKCFAKVEGECPVCRLELFDAVKTTSQIRCGHWLHTDCLNEYVKYDTKCPLCFKSLHDTQNHTTYLDQQIASTLMPEELRDKTCDILCNDCGTKSTVKFHFYGLKCLSCLGYNTRQI